MPDSLLNKSPQIKAKSVTALGQRPPYQPPYKPAAVPKEISAVAFFIPYGETDNILGIRSQIQGAMVCNCPPLVLGNMIITGTETLLYHGYV